MQGLQIALHSGTSAQPFSGGRLLFSHTADNHAAKNQGIVARHPAVQVTGANLVPFTLQKQNALAATLGDQLRFASVFSVRLISVDQRSPSSGLNVSSADVSFVVQQNDDALYVGEVCHLCHALTALLTLITSP